FDRHGPAVRIEVDHAVALRVLDVIAKYGCTALELRERATEGIRTVEYIIPQTECDVIVTNERLCNQECLSDAFGFELLAVFDHQAPLAAVAQQLAKARKIVRCGNETKLAYPILDQSRERVINHRFVVNRLELFAGDQRKRIQT